MLRGQRAFACAFFTGARWVGQENALIDDVNELSSARKRSALLWRDVATTTLTRLQAAEDQLGRRDAALAEAEVQMAAGGRSPEIDAHERVYGCAGYESRAASEAVPSTPGADGSRQISAGTHSHTHARTHTATHAQSTVCHMPRCSPGTATLAVSLTVL